MVKYDKEAQEHVEKELHSYEHKWKSREQAIAVGLIEARKEGAKVPEKKK